MKDISNKIRFEGSFDDGSAYDMAIASILYPLRDKMQIVFYIPVNYKKYLAKKGIEALGDDDLRQIADYFEIGSHGVNHELLTQVDSATQDYEIEESKKVFEELFNKKIEKFCYPRGYFDDKIKDKVKRAGYKMARTVKVGELTNPEDPYETGVTVHIGYDRKEYGMDWYNYAMLKLTDAVELSKTGEVVYSFFGHTEEINRLGQWTRVRDFLRVIREDFLK